MINGAEMNVFELVGLLCLGLIVTVTFLIATGVIKVKGKMKWGDEGELE